MAGFNVVVYWMSGAELLAEDDALTLWADDNRDSSTQHPADTDNAVVSSSENDCGMLVHVHNLTIFVGGDRTWV